MSGEGPGSEERLHRARDLVEAIERGDEQAEAHALQALYGSHEDALYTDLNRVAGELRDILSDVPVGGELSRLARSELPDAQLRLQQVIELTEDAAHTSLAAVEKALPIVKKVASQAQSLGESWQESQPGAGPETAFAELLGTIVTEAALIESCLSEVLLAQGFQDLTGQIIRRVAELVAELERLLSRSPLVERAAASDRDGEQERLRRGTGPALPGGANGKTVSGQQDVDDLLGQLGV